MTVTQPFQVAIKLESLSYDGEVDHDHE
jgi:hypothetical protein